MTRKMLLAYLAERRNLIFVVFCFLVHLISIVMFCMLHLFPLMIVNIISSVFYLCMIALYKSEADIQILWIYIEIIVYSIIGDLLVGGLFTYNYFVIGMVAVISYLLSDKYKHKHILQGCGALIAIFLYFVKTHHIAILPYLYKEALPYENSMSLINLLYTILTLVYVSGLYTIELTAAKETLKYTSNHDTLTDLYNRRFFEQALQRSITENSNCFSIAMFDIDDFKKVNDHYGHDAGDKVLEELSQCLKNNLKEGHLAIRWGGEEFILYMPLTDKEMAKSYISGICNEIRNMTIKVKENVYLSITATVGIETGHDLSQYEEVIKLADEKLYKGKKQGKNCIVAD